MVKSYPAPLDRTFAALADPTRRAIVAALGEGRPLSVSDIAKPFAMSLPAVMKHLDVLAEAGLVIRTKAGRTVSCELSAGPMEEAVLWLARYQRFWTRQIDRLQAFLEEEPCPPLPSLSPGPPSSPSPASPSGATSGQHPSGSMPPGRSPKR